MIKRLLEVDFSNFRCFGEKTQLPLDADIVLIYGQNGAGKTSLLSALEFALTGRVEELSGFQDDYPRCLTNVCSQIPAQVAVKFRTKQDHDVVLTRKVDADQQDPVANTLSQSEEKFLRDRCYLSQGSLGRLLEQYQAVSKETPEQPLVRFIRELLGLDVLENLTAGLYDTGNILRIENNVPALQRARQESSSASEKIKTLLDEQLIKKNAWQQSLISLQTAVAEIGDPAPSEPWNSEGVTKRSEKHSSMDESGALSTSLQQLRRSQGQIENIIGNLTSMVAFTPRESLQQRLDTVIFRIAELDRIADGILRPLTESLSRIGQRFIPSDDLTVRVANIDVAVRSVLDRKRAEAQVLVEISNELEKLRIRDSDLAKRINELTNRVDSPAAISERWIQALTLVLDHVNGDDCPVCGRDFSETANGDLSKHIRHEIERLRIDAQSFGEMVQQRDQLKGEHSSVVGHKAAIEAQCKSEQERQDEQRSEYVELEKLRDILSALAPIISEWQQQRNIAGTLNSEIKNAEIQEHNRVQAKTELAQIAQNISLPSEIQRDDCLEYAKLAAEHTQKRADAAERQLNGANRLRAFLNQAKTDADEVQRVGQDIDKFTKIQEKAKEQESRVRRQIETAKNLSKAATNAKTNLLKQVFNEQLNSLWHQLFQRFVKLEPFTPSLGEPKTVRGQIRTTIEGRRKDVDVFQQFASVASSGNLNTAALSLFLSLNLIEVPRHDLLILDDPVQAMDDLHVVEFANVLREIRRQSGRQIVIAVHERALFDYLLLELGPTDQKASLLAVELKRVDLEKPPEITWTPHRWKPDKVQFGSVALG